MKICVYGAASKEIAESFKEAGYALGSEMAKRGHSLIFGGGDNGMMGAVARGVHESGGHVMGIQPSFFNVDGLLYPLCDEYIYTETLHERKQNMENMSDGFVITPGGVGTYDEFFEILTLRQLGRHNKPIVILNTNGYFDPLLALLRHTVDGHFMNEKNLSLYLATDDINKALDYLENPDEIEIDVAFLRNIK